MTVVRSRFAARLTADQDIEVISWGLSKIGRA
jgi:hypothetical protein